MKRGRYYTSLVVLVGQMLAASAGMAQDVSVPQEYQLWLANLKKEMIEKGIAPQTVETVFAQNYYHPRPEAVDIDRKQIEFVLTSTDYLNRMLSAKKVKEGQQKYRELYPLFHDMEKKYGVPFEFIVAFWGME